MQHEVDMGRAIGKSLNVVHLFDAYEDETNVQVRAAKKKTFTICGQQVHTLHNTIHVTHERQCEWM